MTSLKSRSAIAMFSLLGVLGAAGVARADDANILGCRAEDQDTELVSDCDQNIQEAKLKAKPPVIPPPTSDPLYMILSGEGGKHDHDRDPDRGGHSGGGNAKGNLR